MCFSVWSTGCERARETIDHTDMHPNTENLLDDAHDAFFEGNYGEVELLCRAVLEEAPQERDALNLLAVSLLEQRKYAAGLDVARRLADVVPDSVTPLLSWIECAYMLGDVDAAGAAQGRLLQAATGDVDVGGSALLLAEMGVEDGGALLEAAESINPEDAHLPIFNAYICAGGFDGAGDEESRANALATLRGAIFEPSPTEQEQGVCGSALGLLVALHHDSQNTDAAAELLRKADDMMLWRSPILAAARALCQSTARGTADPVDRSVLDGPLPRGQRGFAVVMKRLLGDRVSG